jgi:hypothetical protein
VLDLPLCLGVLKDRVPLASWIGAFYAMDCCLCGEYYI